MKANRWWLGLIIGLWCGAIAFSGQSAMAGFLVNYPSVASVTGQSATVMGVSSGQVIEVQYANATNAINQPIRLIGLQAPAQGQHPWDQAVKTYLEELLLGQTVLLETDQELLDYKGRLLAYVWLGDQLVNQLLVAAGYVLEEARSPNLKYEDRLQQAQHRARLLGLGIWNPDQPMRQTPQEFRES